MSTDDSSLQKRSHLGKRTRQWFEDWFGGGHDVPGVTLQRGVDEVTAVIVAHVLSRPDSIRQRAQNAATISGALAAALVVAAVSGLKDARDSLTTWFVIAAICLFVLSAVLSVYAVAFPHKYRRDGATKRNSAGVLGEYQLLVEQYENYADEVRRKMRWAAAASWLALPLTALALATEIRSIASSNDSEQMTVLVSKDALSAVKALCPNEEPERLSRRIRAKVPPSELAKAMVELDVEELDVAKSPRRHPCDVRITLPRDAILAAAILPSDD